MPPDDRELAARADAKVASGQPTYEAEFRLRITRPDRQRFGLCLQESELRPGRNPADMESWAQRQQACLSYPAGELLRFDSLELSLAANGAPRLIRLPGDLPPRGWIHLALELRPDGVCAGFVNHRFVGQAPIRLDNEPRTRWRVLIIGSAVETNLFVRNLLLRSGAQHAVTGEGH